MGKTEKRLVCLVLILAVIVTALFAVLIARRVTGGTEKQMETETPPEIRPPVAETPPAWQRARVEETVAYVGPLPYTPVVMPELDLTERDQDFLPLAGEEAPEPVTAFPSRAWEEMWEETPEEFTVSQDDEGPGETYVWLGRYNIVGYDTCPQCCGNSSGITASGTVATVGRTVAVKGLPFGTRLYIDGVGERVVEDRGYLADGVIDVLCENHAECYAITGVYDVWEIVPTASGGENRDPITVEDAA